MSAIYEIISVGKLKNSSPFSAAYDEYQKRLQGRVSIIKLEGKYQGDEHTKVLRKINPDANIIALDEKGKTLTSIEFANKIEQFQTSKNGKTQIIIGGADGLSHEIRQKADLVLSFGKQTWPHMMVRIMLLEQLYRAEKIIAGHPYHRE